MKKTDIAYVAGIIDGEGNISLVHQSNTTKSLIAVVTVHNTNEWLIQWLHLAFGGHTYVTDDGYEEKGWKPIHRWRVTSMQALDVLELVYPYLRLKKPQAEIAIRFLKMRGRKGRWLTDKEKAIGEAQRIVMANLNKVGAKKQLEEKQC